MSNRTTLSKKVRFEVFKRDSFVCQYCGKAAPNVILEVDHIHPVSKGGLNDILNLITSCYDCNRGKSDRNINDDSVIVRQRKQLEILQERRDQIESMFEWRNELNKINEDTNNMVISYVKEKIDQFTLTKSNEKKISILTNKHELVDVLDSIDISAKKYLYYDSNGSLTKDSTEEFINKIGGILINKNKSEIERKASYIKGICRKKFNYWNPQTGSIILNNYINALRDNDWDEERIIQDLENEIQPKTIECKNWSEWRKLLEKWTEDIKNWQASDEENLVTDEDILEIATELLAERNYIIPALEYIGKPFDRFSNEKLVEEIDTAIINYLTDLEEYFLKVPDQRKYIPYSGSYIHRISMLYSPVDSLLTYWLSNAVGGMIVQLFEPIDFYIKENPQPDTFGNLAAKYVELFQTENA